MARLIIRCPTHGPVPADDILGGTSNSVVMIDNSARCPICGAFARIENGEYSFDDRKGISLAKFTPITPAQAHRLRTVATWAREQLDTGAAEVEVRQSIDTALAKNAPGWKPVLDALLSTRAVNLYQFLGFILMLIVFFGLDPASQNDNPAPTIDVEELGDLLDRYLDGHIETPLAAPEAPKSEDPPAQDA